MKKAIAILWLVIIASTALAQNKTKEDYENVFGQYVRFYNNIKADSLSRLFFNSEEWTQQSLREQHASVGKIVSFKYIGPFKDETDVYGNVMAYFKVTFDKVADIKDTTFFGPSPFNGKRNHAAGIALDKNNKIAGRRLFTTSEQIDSLIAQY
jgi:hypothetical protein